MFKSVIEAVKDTLEELHIHENAITEDAFVGSLLETLGSLPRIKNLNIAKNGQLTKSSTVGMLINMATRWSDEQETEPTDLPLPLEKLNIQGTYLHDEGLAEMLPILASPAFAKFRFLNIVATKLT